MTLTEALWSADPKTRLRLKQWAISLVMYAASGVVLLLGVPVGVIDAMAAVGWVVFVSAGLALFYTLIRSGWSRSLSDPALTDWQSIFGVFTVLWGYVMCNEVRSATLYPLTVILTFGAFSLSSWRMAWLTLLTLVLLAATMVMMHRLHPGRYDVRVDTANFLIMAIMLPAATVVAALLGALRSRLRAQRNELATALATIQELATRDELTGLVNRRHMQQQLEAEERRGERSTEPFAIALIDLDQFKRINDTHGHAVGDEVLRAFADEARRAMRACDVVSRWGGEEFLVLMPGTDVASARLATERLRGQVQKLRVATRSGELEFTFSAGVVEHGPGESVAHAIARADAALYSAKAMGRNKVIVAEGIHATPLL